MIEYALSVDNIFLFVLIFTIFRVVPEQQRRLLFWGVIGALVMRGAMIGAAWRCCDSFEWIIYLFGAYILYAGSACSSTSAKARSRGETASSALARRIPAPGTGDHGGRSSCAKTAGCKFTLLFLVLSWSS